MNPKDILDWVIFGGAIVGIILGFIGLYVGAGAWLKPKLERLGKGHSAKANKRRYCCPAGLGCNDEDSTWRACRRQKAREVATTEEFHDLEASWSNFVGSSAPTAKRKNLAAYEAVRDGIIRRSIDEAVSGEMDRKALLAGQPEDAEGEVTDSNGGRARVQSYD